jgi:hypothetical protein
VAPFTQAKKTFFGSLGEFFIIYIVANWLFSFRTSYHISILKWETERLKAKMKNVSFAQNLVKKIEMVRW